MILTSRLATHLLRSLQKRRTEKNSRNRRMSEAIGAGSPLTVFVRPERTLIKLLDMNTYKLL